MLGRPLTIQEALQRRHELVGDAAADAAIGQLDDVVLAATLNAAILQDLPVDPEIAELVDDQREPPARRRSRSDGGAASSCRLPGTL